MKLNKGGLMDNIENITDSMRSQGYEGKWYSYMDNMTPYRVRYLDDEYTVWAVIDSGQVLIDTPSVRNILNNIRKKHNER